MNFQRSALVRGSDPPKGHRVHTKAGDTWRVPATRRFYMFVYMYDVLCVRGDFFHVGDMIGRWLAWLALMQ